MLAIRSSYLSFHDDPFSQSLEDSMDYESDGLIVIAEGKIIAAGPARQLLPALEPGTPVETYQDCLVVPGFIDTHVHYPQTEMIAAYGEKLLDWLTKYTFVVEQGFADKAHSQQVAQRFVDEQLRNGITSALVYSTVFPQSVDALFEAAQTKGLRYMTGKVCMDRNAPAALLDTAQSAYEDSKALIERWHGKDRLEYAITPRFAPSCTAEELEALGALAQEFPTTLIQTHLNENTGEIAWVKELFPGTEDYLAVYERFGLVRHRTVFGHGIHNTDRELRALHERGASIAHCPTSNFFLGSGYCDIFKLMSPARPVKVGLGTDLGAGTSFSILQTLNEAYKAAQLNSHALSAPRAFYLATRGSAAALGLEDRIGSIGAGLEADLAVIDLKSTPIIDYRMRFAESLEEALFIQLTMGDDRAIAATYANGQRVYTRDRAD